MLAEVDYLKPFWDTHPEDRADLRRFIADGRVEIMGGTYNEPNTNLTSPETTIRNFVHGIGFQRDILGRRPGHRVAARRVRPRPAVPRHGGRRRADVQLVGARAAPPVGADGRTTATPSACSSPASSSGSPRRGAACSPTTCPRTTRRAGGWTRRRRSQEAEAATYELFAALKKVALTRNVLLPVGTDYTPPNKWVTEIHRDWNARYTWPRFVCALPQEFFAAVRAELAERGVEAVAADPRHEPDLHRQGRVLHRHQAGQPGRRERGARRRAVRRVRRACSAARPIRRRRWPRRGCSWPTARTTTRSPARNPTRSTSTC